jgi:hypothetical protein
LASAKRVLANNPKVVALGWPKRSNLV